MEALTNIKSTAVPLPIDHVDTDQIIPARFLKSTTRLGFGENLFRDWRYDKDDKENPDFALNQATYKGEILLVGQNFGSGSSREHAAWAIQDYGFKAVVSSRLADIFKNNCLNNGLLAIDVSEEFMQKAFDSVAQNPAQAFEIDLADQSIQIVGTDIQDSFDIELFKKDCIMKGLDNIDYLVHQKSVIESFENQRINTY